MSATKKVKNKDRVEYLLRVIHATDHRAVVPYGACRMCDVLVERMEQRLKEGT